MRHERDVAIGRSDGYLPDQILICINIFTIQLGIAGLYFYAVSPAGQRYRLLAFMFVAPLLLFLVAKGRGYYMAPAYPMLLAAGAVWWESRLLASNSLRWATWTGIFIGGVSSALIAMPVAPINSPLWKISSKINEDLKEEIGWPELVNTVAQVYYSLPPDERSKTGILTGNYGEAGAINLYGPSQGLPAAISVVNSYWLRGYGDPPPEKVIVLGLSRKMLARHFESCDAVAKVTNSYGIKNEEIEHSDIFLCRNLREPWPEFWKQIRSFG